MEDIQIVNLPAFSTRVPSIIKLIRAVCGLKFLLSVIVVGRRMWELSGMRNVALKSMTSRLASQNPIDFEVQIAYKDMEPRNLVLVLNQPLFSWSIPQSPLFDEVTTVINYPALGPTLTF